MILSWLMASSSTIICIYLIYLSCINEGCCQKHLFCLVLYVFMQILILCSQKSKVYLCVFVHCSVHLGCLTGGINDVWNCLATNLLYKKYNYNFDQLEKEYYCSSQKSLSRHFSQLWGPFRMCCFPKLSSCIFQADGQFYEVYKWLNALMDLSCIVCFLNVTDL